MSTRLVEHIFDENDFGFSKADVQMVQDLISGDHKRYQNEDYHWVFDIVNNKRNFIDVDKFDYINRDTHHVGITVDAEFDIDALVENARMIDN